MASTRESAALLIRRPSVIRICPPVASECHTVVSEWPRWADAGTAAGSRRAHTLSTENAGSYWYIKLGSATLVLVTLGASTWRTRQYQRCWFGKEVSLLLVNLAIGLVQLSRKASPPPGSRTAPRTSWYTMHRMRSPVRPACRSRLPGKENTFSRFSTHPSC